MSNNSPPDPAIEIDAGASMLANRLKKNLRNLGKWAKKNQIECYRLYDADLPEYAFAIDLYGAVVHMQEYKAPATISAKKVELRREQAIAAVLSTLNIAAEQLIVKTREKQKGSDQYQVQSRKGHFFAVAEGHANFLVNLEDYLDTGLFLDHRPIRQYIAANCTNKRFLNLFCYTASASVHAAKGGASSTVSVDLSNTYLDWARKNFTLNGLGGKQHRLLQKDCVQFVAHCKETFDLIFLDPPSFSNSKKTDTVLDLQRDHVELIRNTSNLLAAGGLLIFSTNKRRFKLAPEITEAFDLVDYSRPSIDKDFERNAGIHQVWFIRRRDNQEYCKPLAL